MIKRWIDLLLKCKKTKYQTIQSNNLKIIEEI